VGKKLGDAWVEFLVIIFAVLLHGKMHGVPAASLFKRL
jgi:hypothetical protein